MKHFNFWALALTAIIVASCTSEDDLTLSPPANQAEEETMAPILFTSSQSAFTRAEFTGAEAAKLLGNKFVVFGYKGAATGSPSATSTVFDNYLVGYEENSANKTESNSSNWEYVGKTPIKHATDNGITQQTIKYWDYTQTQYDFIAWSTGSKTAIYEKENDEIPAGKVLVSEITPQAATSPATGLGTAYTFEGEAEDLKECYIADLMTVYKGAAGGTYNVVSNGYQQPVTLKFRQLGTKVRIGIYETVPGYSVKNVQFYSAAASDDASADAAKIFTTVANGIYKEGKYTVTFPTVDQPTVADNNQAHIDFAPKTGAAQKTTVDWGKLVYTYRESGESSKEAIYLGRTSNTASFAKVSDTDPNFYVVYLPNQNGTNLNLRVNYTLESIDGSKETIEVKGATAQVPLIYTQWKPGFAYTYLFKISDKTNGHTGVYDPTKPDDTSVNSDPAGLYPITFDAVAVNSEEDATQETITTVSTPSITTYQNGSNVVNNNEYTVLTSSDPKINGHIYVTVNDADKPTYKAVDPTPTSGTSVAKYYTNTGTPAEPVYTPCAANATSDGTTTYYKKIEPALPNGNLATLTGKAALYTIPAGKTEAEVVDALSLQDENATAAPTGTITGRSGLVLTPSKAVTDATSISDAGDYALTNSVEYGADGNAISVGTDQALRFQPAASTTYAFVYTKQAATGTATPIYQPVSKTAGAAVGDNVYRYALKPGTTGDVEKGVTYFAKNDATEGSITAFLGQNVSNLYLNPTGTEQATGLAKTGTTYYYTTNGQTFNDAHNVNYADFGTATLYKDKECTETLTPAEKSAGPVNGQAYYWKDGDDKVHYCVILPQRAETLFVIDTNEANVVPVTSTDNAVKGMIYLDKYTKNNGVYYVKIIKVQ